MREEEVAPPLLHPGIYARISLWLGLARPCNNESDWLIHGENMWQVIPGDAIKCTISARALCRKAHITW